MSHYTPSEIFKTFIFFVMQTTKKTAYLYNAGDYYSPYSYDLPMYRKNIHLRMSNGFSGFTISSISQDTISATLPSRSYLTFSGDEIGGHTVLQYLSTEKMIINSIVTKIAAVPGIFYNTSSGRPTNSVQRQLFSFDMAQNIYDIDVSSVFKQISEVSYTSSDTSGLLGYNSNNWALESTTEVSVQLLNGWEYALQEFSQHAIHYVLKVETGGTNDYAKLIFKSFPYLVSNPTIYLQTSGKSMYSEFLPTYLYSGNITSRILGTSTVGGNPITDTYYTYYIYHHFKSSPDTNAGIWLDSRRKDIDNSETDAITMLLKDATHLGVYHHFLPWVPETIAEFTFEQNFKQCTYFYGKYILLGEDMKVYHLMDNGTLVQILDSGIDSSETVMLVAHPDQDLCYLLGGSKQFIIDRDLDYTMVESAWSGLAEGLRYTNFDCRGRVWVGKQCRSKTTLEEIHSIAAGGICNFTYFAGSDGVCYDLDGNALSNIPATFVSYVHYSNLIWKYPQAVEVPWGEEDFKRQSNRDVWYGRNTSTGELEPYDETNAIPIELDEADNESCLLSDGVRVVFNDNAGTRVLSEGDFIYFTVARGIIKDVLRKIELRSFIDLRDYHAGTNEFTISSATHYVPEYDDPDFINISTVVFNCTINSLPATIITSGSPTQGQVHVNANGTLTFNTADIGVIANIEYYVAKDPYVS